MPTFALSARQQSDLHALLMDLVQIPSPTGQEGQVAARLAEEMQRLGFRDVHADAAGNVVGFVGAGQGSLLMFNGHMDTVKVSSPEDWHHAPFGSAVEDGRLYGVGACDQKGGLAAMIYGAELLRGSGMPVTGDVVLACVVDEEPCEGLGTRALMEAIPDLDMTGRRRIPVGGEVPSPISPPPGCPFHPRCPLSDGRRCVAEVPALIPARGAPQTVVACHAVEEGRDPPPDQPLPPRSPEAAQQPLGTTAAAG